MKVIETSTVGAEVLQSRTQSIILGISINNSYFKEETIEHLIAWAQDFSKMIYLMIPDEPSVHTIMGLGYTREVADTKSRLKSNAIENKCKRVIAKLKLLNVKIVRWNSVVGSLKYLESLVEIKYAYDNDQLFQDALRSATREVLVANGSLRPSEKALDYGVQFLLKELAFINRADAILSEGKIVYVYHKTMQVLKDIICGNYIYKASSNIGFATVC